jgi:hypothetical protein
MAKAVARRSKGVSMAAVRRVRSGRAGWVRKNVVMDQRKLDAARRALGVETETIRTPPACVCTLQRGFRRKWPRSRGHCRE